MNVSETEVAALYETYPYPAHGIVSTVVAQLARPTIIELQARLGRRKLNVLDAGCGTGEQALGLVKAFPDLEVTGIDFSEASLEFARRLATRHALPARFLRADLARPLEGAGAFDLIVSVGALHHLKDPAEGLRTLRGVAGTGGVLLAMVYGTFGKSNLFLARDALNLLAGSEATREEKLALLSSTKLAVNEGPAEYVRTFLRRRKFGPRIALREAIERAVRGRSSNYQADAYTHPREASYTWAELDELLTQTGWRLLGWPEKSGMPDDPKQLFAGEAALRLARMSRLEQASVYERVLCPSNLYFLAAPA